MLLLDFERDIFFGVNFSTNKWNNQQRWEEEENAERQCNHLLEEQYIYIYIYISSQLKQYKKKTQFSSLWQYYEQRIQKGSM